MSFSDLYDWGCGRMMTWQPAASSLSMILPPYLLKIALGPQDGAMSTVVLCGATGPEVSSRRFISSM